MKFKRFVDGSIFPFKSKLYYIETQLKKYFFATLVKGR